MSDLYASLSQPNFRDGAFIDGVPAATQDDVTELKRLLMDQVGVRIMELVFNNGGVGGAVNPSPSPVSGLRNKVAHFRKDIGVRGCLNELVGGSIPVLSSTTDWQFADGANVLGGALPTPTLDNLVSKRLSMTSDTRRWLRLTGHPWTIQAYVEMTLKFSINPDGYTVTAKVDRKVWTPPNFPFKKLSGGSYIADDEKIGGWLRDTRTPADFAPSATESDLTSWAAATSGEAYASTAIPPAVGFLPDDLFVDGIVYEALAIRPD